MKLNCAILAFGLCAVILAGCGGTGISAPATVTQSAATDVRHDRDGSWMAKDSSSAPLLYVTLPFDHVVNVYTIPAAQLVGQITDLKLPWTVCSDDKGNVWVADDPTYYQASIKEYPHGGTSPVRTLRDTNGAVEACAYDSTTGNLAAATAYAYNRGAYINIFAKARGKPAVYRPADVWLPNSVAFDSLGDLFIAGKTGAYAAGTDWLRKGSSTVTQLKLKKPHTYPHVGVVVSGNELTAIAHASLINQYAIIGNKAKYNGSFTLNAPQILYCSLSNSTLVTSGYNSVYLFDYPAGGNPTLTISGLDEPTGVTISVAPTASHTRK